MKKFMASVCAFIMIFSLFCATSCKSGMDTSETTISAAATNYISKMKATQSDNGAELVLSKEVDNIVFLQYYVGQIQNYLIQKVMTPIYNDGSLKKITYSENTITAKTISEGISKSISTTDTISMTNSIEESLSWEFGVGESTTASASVGVDLGIVTAQTGISETFSISAKVGGSITTNQSQTISKSTTDSINNNYNVSDLEQQCRTTASEFDMSDYEKNYYYALSLVADINIYQVIAYDKISRSFYTTYFISDVASTDIALKMLSSESATFSIPPEIKISPITKVNIDEIPEVNCENTMEFMGGRGTEEDPYLIGNATHFMNIKMYPSAYYRLFSNINMASVNYYPIKEFRGTIFGDGRTISNLNYRDNSVVSDSYVGLFKINRGEILNLRLSNCVFVASPKFSNENINVYGGAIAAVNKGEIKNCFIGESTVIANSSDTAEKFIAAYNEDPREILRGSANWRTWISQSYYSKTSYWNDNLRMRVYAGGVSGVNYGIIDNCSFSGNVESNLYNMRVASDTIVQRCLAGGISGMNVGVISLATTTANVSAWIELDHDAGGMGWVGDTYPKAVCFACGLSVNCGIDASVGGNSNGEEKASYRIYAPQYAFLAGADYNSSTKGHADNLTIKTSDSSCSHSLDGFN